MEKPEQKFEKSIHAEDLEDRPKLYGEIPFSEFGLETYLRTLGLKESDLDGKKILDIGAGTRRFAAEAEKKGIHAQIYSLEPYFSIPKDKRNEEIQGEIERFETKGVREKTIAGKAEDMPFADNAFDLVIAHFSLPAYAANKEQVKKFFSEVNRVVKDGGEIRLYPVNRTKDGKLISPKGETEIDLFINEEIDNLLKNNIFSVGWTNRNWLLILEKKSESKNSKSI